MKLVEINASQTRYGMCAIRVKKVGCIIISNYLRMLLELKDGDIVSFLQDQSDTKNFYIKKSDTPGSKIRITNGRSCTTNNVNVSRYLLLYFAKGANSASCMGAKEPYEYNGEKIYPIITAKPYKLS